MRVRIRCETETVKTEEISFHPLPSPSQDGAEAFCHLSSVLLATILFLLRSRKSSHLRAYLRAMAAAATKVRRFHYEAGFKKRVIMCAETDGNRAAALLSASPKRVCATGENLKTAYFKARPPTKDLTDHTEAAFRK